MRVLIAARVPQLPDLVGGTQHTLSALARWLNRIGYETAILGGIVQVPPIFGDPSWRPDRWLDTPVYRAVDAKAALPSVLDDWRPDVAIVHYDDSALALSVGLEARGIPAIHYLDTPFIRPVEMPPVIAGKRFAALSPFIARRAKILFGIEAQVLPPIIETETVSTPPTGQAVLLVNPTLLKGVGIFLQLAAALPDIPFLAVESWDLSEAWRNILINRAMALGNIALWPAVDDIGEALAESRLVLMPSIHEETWGRIITEAQARGIPAVVSDRGALPETLGPGGIVVPLDGGIAAWIGAVRTLTENPGLYAGLSAAASTHAARAAIQPRSIATEWKKALREVASGQRAER